MVGGATHPLLEPLPYLDVTIPLYGELCHYRDENKYYSASTIIVFNVILQENLYEIR